MSTPVKRTPSPSPPSTKKISCKIELNINGKIYREVRNHIVYYLYKVSRSSVDSLVDRVDKGGVACDNVIVIGKNPDRTTDIRGIDNHEIASIHLITTGCVILTT